MINGASGAAGMNPLKFVDIESGEVDGVPFGAADVNGSIAVDVGYPDTSNRGQMATPVLKRKPKKKASLEKLPKVKAVILEQLKKALV